MADFAEVEARRKKIYEEIGKILKEHDGLESNIPVNDITNYWTLKRELNGLPKTPAGNP
jgi:hypothetical protein